MNLLWSYTRTTSLKLQKLAFPPIFNIISPKVTKNIIFWMFADMLSFRKCCILLCGFKHFPLKCYFSPIKRCLKCCESCAVMAKALPPWCCFMPGQQSCMCCGSIIFKKAKFKPPGSSPWYAEGFQNNINSK